MKKSIELLSNFNTDNLYQFLEEDLNKEKYILKKGLYGQFFQRIFKIINSKKNKNTMILWSQVEHTFKNFDKILNYENVSIKDLNKELDQYILLMKKLSLKCENIIIFSWTIPRYEKGRYLNDFTHQSGIVKNIDFINNYVAKSLEKNKNIYFLNSNFFIKDNDSDYNPKLWYAAKIPYSQETFRKTSLEINKVLNYIYGNKIKLIILDLDNTLWGGVLGDLGWKKIKIGGLSISGEAFYDFQKKLKALNNLGVQLAISSKNEEYLALEAINKNPNIILKRNNFSSWRINWKDKATNVKEIINELNLLNESVLFIDDNPAERDRVRNSVKGINVPDWPSDPVYFSKALNEITEFSFSSVTTKEDLKRTKYYKDNFARQRQKKFLTENEWLKSLNTKIYFKNINNENKDRIIQLINRTNQMNLSTNRLTEKDLNIMKKKSNIFLYCCRVEDKFGDMGIVGFFSLEIKDKKGIIRDFLLSCRAFGREIERSMIYKCIQLIKYKNIKYLELRYKKTKKNKPCLNFLNENFDKKGKIYFLKNIELFKKPKNLKNF